MTSEIFSVWFLIGAALVFWMQAGFAMVETGFTRAKNAGNILMKNLMDFCIGTGVFILIGFGFFLGEDLLVASSVSRALIFSPTTQTLTGRISYSTLCSAPPPQPSFPAQWQSAPKFLSYCIYSGVISALVYPIEAHWIWARRYRCRSRAQAPSCSG